MKTIQISIYDWQLKEELVYEAQVSNIEEFLALTYRFDKRVKYKKPTDKNWYYAKTMVKRLFKKELEKNKNIFIKFVTTNDLKPILDEKYRKEKEKLEFENWLEQFDYREGLVEEATPETLVF